MPISILTAAAHGNLATQSITLPAGIPASSTAYLVLHMNTLPTTTTPPSGWTEVQAPIQAGTVSNAYTALYSKSVGASDSGTTVACATTGTTPRYAVAVVVVSGGTIDVAPALTATGTASTSHNYGAVTPGADNCFDVLIGGFSNTTAGGAISHTPPAGWTEDVDNSTTYGTSIDVATWIGHRTLSGQSGVSQAAGSVTANVNSRANLWRFTVSPTAPANVSPTVTVAASTTTPAPGQTVTLTATGTDSDGTIASYQWTQTAGPAVTLTGSGATRSFVAPYRRPTDGPATLTFSVTATDNAGATSTAATVSATVPVHPEWWFTPSWATYGPRIRTAL